jgi:hypothetical protein
LVSVVPVVTFTSVPKNEEGTDTRVIINVLAASSLSEIWEVKSMSCSEDNLLLYGIEAEKLFPRGAVKVRAIVMVTLTKLEFWQPSFTRREIYVEPQKPDAGRKT